MNITGVKLEEQELNVRCLRIQVRVKGLIEGLIASTSATQTPAALFHFMKRLTNEGKCLPTEFLLPAEKKRLAFDSNGRSIDVTNERKQLLIATFFVHRILIGQVLLKPKKFLGSNTTDAHIRNFKPIASVLHAVSAETLEEMFLSPGFDDDGLKPGSVMKIKKSYKESLAAFSKLSQASK